MKRIQLREKAELKIPENDRVRFLRRRSGCRGEFWGRMVFQNPYPFHHFYLNSALTSCHDLGAIHVSEMREGTETVDMGPNRGDILS